MTTLAITYLAQAVTPEKTSSTEFHPEKEFELHPYVSLHLGGLDMSINKAVVYLWLGALLTILIGIVFMRARLGVRPGSRQTVGESLYETIQSQIVESSLPAKAVGTWFPYVASLFLFILVVNMLGFIPLPLTHETVDVGGFAVPTWGIYAATAQLSVTLALAICSVVFSWAEGVHHNGLRGFLASFKPPGLPPVTAKTFPAVAAMYCLEVISNLFRLVSLSVRLYANMLAGHMLILIMIGLIFVLGNAFVAIITIPAAVLFYVFEVVIVVTVQAFIFAILTAIYIGSAIEPAH